jgi:flagellar motility protein MotE (MotC chaperone)
LNRKSSQIGDAERDARSKLESSVKFNQDQAFFTISEVTSRIVQLEATLQREEKLRIEMREKLRVSDDQSRELANFIKSLQTQSDQELT